MYHFLRSQEERSKLKVRQTERASSVCWQSDSWNNRSTGYLSFCFLSVQWPPSITTFRPIQDYTAWWQRRTGTNNLPTVVTWQRKQPLNSTELNFIKTILARLFRNTLIYAAKYMSFIWTLLMYNRRCYIAAVVSIINCDAAKALNTEWANTTGSQKHEPRDKTGLPFSVSWCGRNLIIFRLWWFMSWQLLSSNVGSFCFTRTLRLQLITVWLRSINTLICCWLHICCYWCHNVPCVWWLEILIKFPRATETRYMLAAITWHSLGFQKNKQ